MTRQCSVSSPSMPKQALAPDVCCPPSPSASRLCFGHVLSKLIGSPEPLIRMMSIVHCQAEHHNDIADAVVLIVYTSFIMNDFMTTLGMHLTGRDGFFVTTLCDYTHKRDTVTKLDVKNKSCGTYLSAS